MEESNREQLREMSQRLAQVESNLFTEGTWEEGGVLFAPPPMALKSALSRSPQPRTFTPIQLQPVEERKGVWQKPNVLQADAQEPEKGPRAIRWLTEGAETAQGFPQHHAGPLPTPQGTRSVWRLPRDFPIWAQGRRERIRDVDQDSNMRSFAPEAVVRFLTQSVSNLLTPVMMEAMANCPKFLGQREHFEDRVKEWGKLL